MKNNTDLQFTDISSEEYRNYTFPDGLQITINNPTHLNVSAKGNHRLLDASGVSHYIPTGWVWLSWKAKDGQPNFVK
jgi:hypothetical protein